MQLFAVFWLALNSDYLITFSKRLLETWSSNECVNCFDTFGEIIQIAVEEKMT